jgi:hypothetical protein
MKRHRRPKARARRRRMSTQPSSLNSSQCCAGGNDRCTGLPGLVVVLVVRPGRSMLEGSETKRGSVAAGQARGFGAELAEQLLKI